MTKPQQQHPDQREAGRRQDGDPDRGIDPQRDAREQDRSAAQRGDQAGRPGDTQRQRDEQRTVDPADAREDDGRQHGDADRGTAFTPGHRDRDGERADPQQDGISQSQRTDRQTQTQGQSAKAAAAGRRPEDRPGTQSGADNGNQSGGRSGIELGGGEQNRDRNTR